MTDIIIESIRALFVGLIVAILARQFRTPMLRDIPGWKFILAGVSLVFFGSLLDITDNFPALGRFVIVGDTVYESFLEKIVGYLLGYLSVAVGLLQWLPAVIAARQTENALRESEERFRSIFDGTIDGIVVTDAATRKFVLANATFCSMLGCPREEVPQLSILDIHPPESLPFVLEQFEKQLRQEITLARNTPVKRSDGSVFYADINSTPITLAGRQCLLGSFRDISERRQAEHSLRKSEAFNREILQSMGEGFVVIDPDYRILSANRAYCEQMQVSCEEILGKHCYEVSHGIGTPCFREGEDCAPLRTFETGEPHYTLHTHHDRNGNPLFIETRSFPMKDADGRIYAVLESLNNITEKRALEGQLRHAQRMGAVGTLAGGIAHDFNNVLNVIMGYAGVLQLSETLSAEGHQYLREIVNSVDRAAHLTRGILAFSRKQNLALKMIDLRDVASGVQRMLARILGEDVRIETQPADAPLRVMADFVQLEQVLMNLATNARDAMPRGGVFRIACGRGSIDQAFIDLHGFGHAGPYAVLTVSDTGHGMPEPVRTRIFEPFFSTKDVGRGTGLGMSIVYGIVKQHKGYITCRSEEGRGTTFQVYLPFIENPAVPDAAAGLAGAEFERGSGTVLLVEDDASVRGMLRTVLERGGYAVVEAANGDEAVRVFDERGDCIDIVVMDMLMPGRNGLETEEALRLRKPDLPCIFVSGYSASVLSERGISRGDITLLDKPVSPQKLLHEVAVHLNGHAHVRTAQS